MVAKPLPPPPPPAPQSLCIAADEDAVVQRAGETDGKLWFCLEKEGASTCFLADKSTGFLSKAATPDREAARVTSTEKDVTVCSTPDACVTLVPKGKPSTPWVAVAEGDTVVIMVGQTAEVWSLAEKKRKAVIKYAKGAYACGVPQIVGESIFVNAQQCKGPAARGQLFSTKGKRIADVGGKEFGTYASRGVQVAGTEWAFLEENAKAIVIQDVATGAIKKTISLVSLWGEGNMGNPGESVMVRTSEGLAVVAGAPKAGILALAPIGDGEVTVVSTPRCPSSEPAATD